MAASPMRSFDPRRVGSLECRAWETYYRRKWARVPGRVGRAGPLGVPHELAADAGGCLAGAAGEHGLGAVPRQRPGHGAGADAPLLPAAAQERVGRRFDPTRASELEVEWWRVHREHQHAADSVEGLVAALRDLYAYTYQADPAAVARRRRCGPRRWTSRTAGSRPAATRPTPCWPRSAPCSSSRTPRCSRPCTARRAATASRGS